MATRPDLDLKMALVVTRTVASGQTVVLDRMVKDGSNDKEVQPVSAGEAAIGVVIALGKLDGAAGDEVQIAFLAGAAVLQVKVGTGGATRGLTAKSVADGVTDATPVIGTGTTLIGGHGFFTQNGVAGDVVGMVPAPAFLLEA